MKVLVTGGGGFLGGAIARQLRSRGDEVLSFSRGTYPELSQLGVEHIQGDLGCEQSITKAVEGCNAVFHVAAKPGIWGPLRDYYQANVIGTCNVISACRTNGVKYLIHTSSPSVVFNGDDMEGIDESVEYPDSYKAHYPMTKALAEQLVIQANCDDLMTVSLRPHLIWGPGDNHLIPRMISRGRAGSLRRIGTRNCLIDTIYIDNAADAHVLAADHLMREENIGGRCYFISQGEPIETWELINRILAMVDCPPVTRSVPRWIAYGVGGILELIYKGLRISSEPRMTRFLAEELSTAHWFDISAAKCDFGFAPRISLEEGLVRLSESLKCSRNDAMNASS